jgi:hypothetical protein
LAGQIATTVAIARERVLEYVVGVIEAKMGDTRVAKATLEIQTLSREIISGDLSIDLTVALLGGRRAGTKRARFMGAASCGNGRRGEVTGPFAITDIPAGMAALGEILGMVFGHALGGELGNEVGFGLESLVYDAMESLDVTRTRFLIDEIFDKIRLHSMRRRTRMETEAANIGEFVESVRIEWFDQLRAEEAAVNAARADALLNSVVQTAVPAAGAAKALPQAAAQAAGNGATAAAGTGGGATPPKKRTGSTRRKGTAAAAGAAAASPAAAAAANTTPTAAGTPTPGTPAGGQQQAGASPAGGGTPTTHPPPTFAADSIVLFIDKHGKQGAIEAFDYLTKIAYPGTPQQERPCAFAALAQCAKAAGGGCAKCRTRAALTTPAVQVPAGAVAQVKAACNQATAAKITN